MISKALIISLLLFSNILFAKTSLKSFLATNHIPGYSTLSKNKIRYLSKLLSKVKNKDKSINEKNLCWLAVNYFYASNVKKVFSIENYLKMYRSKSIQSRFFKCVLSDIIYPGQELEYQLNKNIDYHLTLFGNKATPYRRKIVSTALLAKALVTTTHGVRSKKGSKELVGDNVKSAFDGDPMAQRAVEGVLRDDRLQTGGALIFLGLREGLTDEQKEQIAQRMTALATQLNMKPVKDAVEAYINGNVRVYVDSGNTFLVNYKIEF